MNGLGFQRDALLGGNSVETEVQEELADVDDLGVTEVELPFLAGGVGNGAGSRQIRDRGLDLGHFGLSFCFNGFCSFRSHQDGQYSTKSGFVLLEVYGGAESGGMRLSTVFQYQVGQAKAIEEVAGNSRSIWMGMALVLMTAVARNYDQNLISESWLWLIGPLLFSVVSGSLTFSIVFWAWFKRGEPDAEAGYWREWRVFMGLFWMTAPVAWLYAIPVERLMDSLAAAKANLTLLGIVSAWRVALLARAVSVVNRGPFLHALGWIATAAALEILLVLVVGAFTGGQFERRVLAGMGGLRNSPEESLMIGALSNVFTGAMIAFPTLALVMFFAVKRGEVSTAPAQTKRGAPILGLLGLAVFWIAVAWPAQQEQARFVEHKKLIEAGNYRGAIDFLARHARKDYPASRRLEPSPYERPIHERLPPLMKELNERDPQWVRNLYLSYAAVYFSNFELFVRAEALTDLLIGIEELPEGKKWFEANREALKNVHVAFMRGPSQSMEEHAKSVAKVNATFERLGFDPK